MKISKISAIWTLFAFSILNPVFAANASSETPKKSSGKRKPASAEVAPSGIDSPDCLQHLPADFQEVLTEIRKHQVDVNSGSLSAAQAQELASKRISQSTKGDPEAQRLVLLMASEISDRAHAGERLGILQKLVQGQSLDRVEQKTIDDLFQPEQLASVVSAAKPHVLAMQSAGAVITSKGWDLSKVAPTAARTDASLQATLDVFYPGVSSDLKSGRLSFVGDWVLLPASNPRAAASRSFPSKWLSVDEYNRQVSMWVNMLTSDLAIYAKASISAASYSDLMAGRLRDRNQWWGDPEMKTASEIDRDGSYQRITQVLDRLHTHYGFTGDDLRPYYQAMQLVAQKESEALEKSMKQLKSAQMAFATAPLIGGGLLTIGRGAQLLFLFGMGVGMAENATEAAISKIHGGGPYLCYLSKKMGENLADQFMLSALFAPLGAVSPAVFTKIPGVSPALANTLFKRTLQALAVPGLVFAAKSANDARIHQATGVEAQKAGMTELAKEEFEKRDIALTHATFSAALSAVPWLAGRKKLTIEEEKLTLPPLQQRQGVLVRFSELGQKSLTDYSDPKVFEKDFSELITLRDRTQGVSSVEFRAWWKANSQRYTSPSYLKLVSKNNITLQQVLDGAGNDFFMEVGHVKGATWREKAKFFFKPQALATAAGGAVLAFSKKILDSTWNAVTLSPAMRLVNAYTDTAIVPLEAYLKQKGTKDLGKLSTDEQQWIMHHSEAKNYLAEMETQLNQYRTASKKAVSNSDQEKIWNDFQSYFYRKFLLYNAALPGNMRDGRSFFLGFELNDTVGLASSMAQRYDGYNIAKRGLEDLQARQGKGETLSELEINRMKDFQSDMDRDLDFIASVMVVQQIRKFMYRDDLLNRANPLVLQSQTNLDQTFDKLCAALGYNFFLQKVADRMEKMFREYKFTFAEADQEAIQALESASKKK